MALRPYQLEGAAWLADRKAGILADEMGLGKTPQAIAAADDIGAWRVLVVCPAVARANWISEFKKFSWVPRPFTKLVSRKCPIPKGHSVVASFEMAVARRDELQGKWDAIIIDEAHYLKSWKAKRTWAILGKEGLIRGAERVWALTGTPMPNHAGELWTWLYTLGRTRLGYYDFVMRFCVFPPGCGPGDQVVGTNLKRKDELKMLLGPVMKRRLTKDVLQELPPLTFSDVLVERSKVDPLLVPEFREYALGSSGTKALQATVEKQDKLIRDAVKAAGPNAMEILETMATSVSTLRRYVGLSKVKAVCEMVNYEIAHGRYDKLVIFAVHRQVITLLEEGLKAHKPVTIHGGTSESGRQKAMEKFRTGKHHKVFIGNIQAAGTAITLTTAHNVLFVEQSWVPADNAQASKRCHRFGQKYPVEVRFVGLEDSIDEYVAHVVRRKTAEILEILDRHC